MPVEYAYLPALVPIGFSLFFLALTSRPLAQIVFNEKLNSKLVSPDLAESYHKQTGITIVHDYRYT